MDTPADAASASQTAHRLLSYLPAIYRDDPFAGRFLWAFEQVLVELEGKIGDLSTYFDPLSARPDFLPWLSSWVSFTLRADLQIEQQRAFLANIVSLYRRRGTKQNLADLLTIFIGSTPDIQESTDPKNPHFFHVTMNLPRADAQRQLRQSTIANALINLEKPAHTSYDLELKFPTMQIGVTSTIGKDTLLGTGGTAAAPSSTPPPQFLPKSTRHG
jgi:phage tail-like protein